MLTAFARALRTPDLRKKILFTLGVLVLLRVGAHVTVPGVNREALQQIMAGSGAAVVGKRRGLLPGQGPQLGLEVPHRLAVELAEVIAREDVGHHGQEQQDQGLLLTASTDSVYSHKGWCDSHEDLAKQQHLMLADTTRLP